MAKIINFFKEKEKLKENNREKNKENKKADKNKKLINLHLGNYEILIEIENFLNEYHDKATLENFNGIKKRFNLGLLEKLVSENEDNFSLENIIYLQEKSRKTEAQTYANVVYVNSSELPSGNGWRALGMYDSSSNTIYIANNLSQEETEFVYWHEVAHSLGIKDEDMADDYATSRVGYRARKAA